MQPDLDTDFASYTPADAVRRAERAAIGAALTSRSFAETVGDTLDPTDCWHPAHQTILGAALTLAGQSGPVDPITVGDQLTRDGQLGQVGGAPYLHTLQAEAALTTGDAAHYARKVFVDADRRGWLAALQHGVQLASGPDWDPEVHPARIDDSLDALRQLDDRQDHGAWASDALVNVVDRMETGRVTAIETGWNDLDDMLQIEPGHLVILAAKTGAGKSMFAASVARHAAVTNGHGVLLSTLEMGSAEFMERVLAGEARVPLTEVRNPKVPPSETTWKRISYVQPRLMEAPLYLDDTPTVGLAHIRQRLRWMRKQGTAPELLIVDYLQLVTSDDASEERRDLEIAALVRGLRSIAREWNIPSSRCRSSTGMRTTAPPSWGIYASRERSNRPRTRCCS